MEEDIFFTVGELAKYLKIRPITVYKHVEAGKFPAFKIGSKWRFRKSTINKWIETKSNNKKAAIKVSKKPSQTPLTNPTLQIIAKPEADKRRVVITGIGIVSPIGIGKDAFWEALKEGRSGISKIENFDTHSYPVKIAGEVKNFVASDYIDEKTVGRTTRFAHFACCAAQEAIRDSEIDKAGYIPERLGISIGTNLGGLDFAFDQLKIFFNKGLAKVNSFTSAIVVPYAATRVISENFKAKGPCKTFTSSCPASTDAIGYSLESIRRGEVDIMISGGAEAPLHYAIFAAFCISRILSLRNEEAPSPFDARRDGTVLGEGAAILILEELEHAIKRNAKIYAEVSGYASTCDAYHIVNPDPKGVQGARAIKLALEDARVKPQDVNYINAHGTGTTKNDKVETLIIKKVFDEQAYKIPISATKALTGHLLGACGALEAAICGLVIRNSIIPPTINYKVSDPECDLDYVPNKARNIEVNVAVSNTFGLGGVNAVLIFKKYS